MFGKLVVLVALIAVCSATIRPCANNARMPSSISITGCDVNAPTRCKLRRGSDVTGLIGFEACKYLVNEMQSKDQLLIRLINFYQQWTVPH